METLNFERSDGVFRSISDSRPTHFSLEIQLFSSVNEKLNGYKSKEFNAGGYIWKLVFYPKGNRKKNIEGHISVYLEIVGAEDKSPDSSWEVNVDFKLFLLNQNKLNYLVFEDAFTKKTCIHRAMRSVGFDKLIPIIEFTDASNGFLIDNKCVFGAEVYICKERRNGKSECLEKLKQPFKRKYFVTFKRFSSLRDELYRSGSLFAGGYEWAVLLHPKGLDAGKGSHVSLYLECVGLSAGSKVIVDFKLGMVDQVHHHDYTLTATEKLFTEDEISLGWPQFILKETFRKYYLKNDTLTVEAVLTFRGVSKPELKAVQPVVRQELTKGGKAFLLIFGICVLYVFFSLSVILISKL